MKVLRIQARGLPLLPHGIDVCLYGQQRVNEKDKESLWDLTPNIFLNPATAFIGLNASGKTTIMNVVRLALGLLQNESINHMSVKHILNGVDKAVLRIYFADNQKNVNCLETAIVEKRTESDNRFFVIAEEKLWTKPFSRVRTKKQLIDFEGMEPIVERTGTEEYLLDDVSLVIGRNKKNNDSLTVCSLLSYTNENVLPFTENISMEIVKYLDPTVEKLCFEKIQDKTIIRLKFAEKEEIVLNNLKELGLYLSSGTIKGIITFSMAETVLRTGGYLLVDEIENHFNHEIVATMVRLFTDRRLNQKGGVILFTTHYPELLDMFERNDNIYIVRNKGGILPENLSVLLKRNDIKKSEVYRSDFLKGTAPSYSASMNLKKAIAATIK